VTTKKKVTKKKITPVKKKSIKKSVTAKKTVPKKKIKSTKKSTVKKTMVKKSSAKKTSIKKTVVKKSSVKKDINNEKVIKFQASTNKKNKSDIKPVKKKLVTKKKDNKDLTAEMDEQEIGRNDTPMSLTGHLDELRSRFLFVLLTIIVFTGVGFGLSDYLLNFIMEPFKITGFELNIFKLTGGFMIRLKASVITAIILSMPIILWQIWRFIIPAVNKNDRTFSRFSLLAAIALFYTGMSFVFFVLLPFAIKVLLGFIGSDMKSTIGANDYLSFIFLFSFAMGVLFELPIIVMILTRIGILTPQFLIAKRKYSVIIIWVIAAIITPQDILSQVLVAIPLMFLYEISIVISKIIIIRKRRQM
jgi:sec-independent protein translocase protein TatC